MSGRGTISVNQSPQYGDKTVLQKMANPFTSTPMTGNPTPKPTAGRPQGSAQKEQQVAISQTPKPQQELMAEVARKAWAAQQWMQMAMSPGAGPTIRMYARAAQDEYQKAFNDMRGRTPFFEG